MQRVNGPQSPVPHARDTDSTPASAEPYLGSADLFDSLWRFFCSTRLALIVILVIAAAGLAGTLLLQAPAGTTSNPQDYAQWLGQARLKYGAWTDVLSFLQLFDVFNALWFRLLLALLVINTVICTVNRWNGLWRSISRPKVRMGLGFFNRASHSVTVTPRMNPEDAADAISRTLAKSRYRVLSESDDAAVYLYADKNRFGKMGTFLNHISLVLILIGAILGGVLGFRDRQFTVAVGSERAVGFGTDLSLRVDQFIDEYYPEGPPKDFRTDAVLLENGNEVARHTIRVNEPLEYQGIRFYQSYFGPAASITVKDGSGDQIFNDGVALAWRSREDRPIGSFMLPSKGLEVYIVAPISGKTDPLVPAGQMRIETYLSGGRIRQAADNLVMGQSKKIGDLEFTFQRELQFTGLQVAKDPGTPIIWLASALMVIGLYMVFYYPHRRIWIVCRRDQQERSQVLIGATARRDMGFDEEFRRMVVAIEQSTVSAKRPAPVPVGQTGG